VRKLNAAYTKPKWLRGCAETNAVVGLLINHAIIAEPAIS